MHQALPVLLLLLASGCGSVDGTSLARPASLPQARKPRTAAEKIVAHARIQTTWGTAYDNRYVKLAYPGGDLPKDRGVCTDVVVRSLRAAGYDLQKLIHEDMKRAWKAYPRYKGLDKPDGSIDHRRVPNQRVFFTRHGQSLTLDPSKTKDWKPGDFVSWKLDSGLDHIGVLSDRLNGDGLPYAIHNLGTTLEEDVLTRWKITGHYRYPAPSMAK